MPAFSSENMLQKLRYLARMLSRVSVAVACNGMRLAMDIMKVGVPGSLQSLVIVRALTMRISIFFATSQFLLQVLWLPECDFSLRPINAWVVLGQPVIA